MPSTDTNLFRALRRGEFEGKFDVGGVAKDGLLYPGFEPKEYVDDSGNNKTRLADVDYAMNDVTGEREVQPGGGTSLFDVEGWFGYKNWNYFQIPAGTDYPESLYIKKGAYPQRKSKKLTGTHYQIEPKIPMTVDALKGALDTFARNAVARRVELSR